MPTFKNIFLKSSFQKAQAGETMIAKILEQVTQQVICEDLENNMICITQHEFPSIKLYQANHISFF